MEEQIKALIEKYEKDVFSLQTTTHSWKVKLVLLELFLDLKQLLNKE